MNIERRLLRFITGDDAPRDTVRCHYVFFANRELLPLLLIYT